MPAYGTYFDPTQPLVAGHPLNAGRIMYHRPSRTQGFGGKRAMIRDLVARRFDGTFNPTNNIAPWAGARIRGSDGSYNYTAASSQYINLGTWPSYQFFTLLALITPSSVSGFHLIIGGDSVSAGNRVFQFRLNSANIEGIAFNTAGSAFTATGATSLSANSDYFVAMTFDGTTARVFMSVANILKQDGTVSVTGTPSNQTATFQIGATAGGTNFAGNIHMATAWNRVLPLQVLQQAIEEELAGCPNTINWLDNTYYPPVFGAPAGATGKLFRQGDLNGIGSGGPFFKDPLAA